jgi:hypothetical protein
MRFFFGNRGFISTSKPTALGKAKRKPLGRVVEYGSARTITLVVGQKKGLRPKNRKGTCKRKPRQFAAFEVDTAFLALRRAQVGGENVGATRRVGRGFYQNVQEPSVAYEVAFVPSAKEKTFKTFARNMNALAENLAETFCQDSVLIVRDDGRKKSVASAEWSD